MNYDTDKNGICGFFIDMPGDIWIYCIFRAFERALHLIAYKLYASDR